MKKNIYMAIEAVKNGDQFEGKPTYVKEEAISEAKNFFYHLTEWERQRREVYVGVFSVDVGENETAQDVYNYMLLEGTWNNDHDVIDI